jgi:putative endonuclease
MHYVYLLLCQDGSLYAGVTNNLTQRFRKHALGKGSRYVRSRKPVAIVYSERFRSKSNALKREAEIKKWHRAKKLALVGRSITNILIRC